MHQFILFDLDGTLIDSKEGITKSVQHALNYFDIQEPDLDNLTCFIGPPLDWSFKTYYGFSNEGVDQVVAKYRERYSTIGLYECTVYPGIKQLLERLKSEHKILAVATSKPEVFARKVLDKYELSSYFDSIVGCSLNKERNTKAEVIQEVLKQLQVEAKDLTKAVIVGDRKHDVIGAKTCHIQSVGVYYGFADAGELEEAGADYIAHTVEELETILLP